MPLAELDREYIPLSEAARMAGYTDNATLRQAINRGRLKGELRTNELGFPYYVTTREWLIEYIENRPQKRDGRLDRVLADGADEETGEE